VTSAHVVSALGRALRLSREERDHLYRLAGLQPPQDGTITDHIPPGMQRVLTRLGETPVAVFAADWRLIWWNRGWAALLGDPSVIAPEDRKTIRHPDIGEITVDCDVLNDSDTDLKIVIYTAAPGSEDATKLELARLAGARPA
jgi:hypothetical protein